MGDLKKILEGVPTSTSIELIDNGRMVGFCVKFAETGFGFGEVVIGINMEDGEPIVDLEAMKPETVARFFRRVVGTPVAPPSKDL